MVEGVAGESGGSFPNGTLANASCAGITEFWVLVFRGSCGTSDSTVDSVAVVENVGGIKVTSGGRSAVFVALHKGYTMSTFFGAVSVVVFALASVSAAVVVA